MTSGWPIGHSMVRAAVRHTALMALGAVIAGLGAAAYSYHGDLQHARHRISSGSQIAQTSCGSIEYAVAGHGPPVLVVHGAGGGFDQGLDFGAPLVPLGFRVIAMSRFGYLRTPLPEDAGLRASSLATQSSGRCWRRHHSW